MHRMHASSRAPAGAARCKGSLGGDGSRWVTGLGRTGRGSWSGLRGQARGVLIGEPSECCGRWSSSGVCGLTGVATVAALLIRLWIPARRELSSHAECHSAPPLEASTMSRPRGRAPAGFACRGRGPPSLVVRRLRATGVFRAPTLVKQVAQSDRFGSSDRSYHGNMHEHVLKEGTCVCRGSQADASEQGN